MIKDLLVGLNVPPVFVALARAVILAAIAGGLGALITELEVLDWKQFGYAAPVVLGALRQIEGLFDQMQTPNQNDTPPADLEPAG